MNIKYPATERVARELDVTLGTLGTATTSKVTNMYQFNDAIVIVSVVKNPDLKTLAVLDDLVDEVSKRYKVDQDTADLASITSRSIKTNINSING